MGMSAFLKIEHIFDNEPVSAKGFYYVPQSTKGLIGILQS